MNTKYPLKEVFLILIVILFPCLYLAYVYPSLPDTVPVHFNAEGKANGFSSKRSLWYIITLLSLLGAGMYLLLKNISSIDPKKTAAASPQTFQKIAVGVTCLVTVINIIIVYAASHNGHHIVHLLYPLLGLFFVFIGNMMHSIKPNYFVGIRTPWALENEDNWRATHRMGSKIFFAGGILIAVGSLVFSGKAATWLLEGTVVVMVLAPFIYSFLYFKKHKP